jgi:hypothetical protein
LVQTIVLVALASLLVVLIVVIIVFGVTIVIVVGVVVATVLTAVLTLVLSILTFVFIRLSLRLLKCLDKLSHFDNVFSSIAAASTVVVRTESEFGDEIASKPFFPLKGGNGNTSIKLQGSLTHPRTAQKKDDEFYCCNTFDETCTSHSGHLLVVVVVIVLKLSSLSQQLLTDSRIGRD